HRNELHRVSRDVAGRPFAGNERVAEAVALKTELTERHEMAINAGRFLLVHMYESFSVCMKDGHRNVRGAVWCMHISQAYFVVAWARDVGQEREGFFALANIQIVEVTVADIVAGIL